MIPKQSNLHRFETSAMVYSLYAMMLVFFFVRKESNEREAKRQARSITA